MHRMSVPAGESVLEQRRPRGELDVSSVRAHGNDARPVGHMTTLDRDDVEQVVSRLLRTAFRHRRGR